MNKTQEEKAYNPFWNCMVFASDECSGDCFECMKPMVEGDHHDETENY